MIDPDLLARAEAIHRVHPVVELHTDVPVDVRRRRLAGQPAPYRDVWLPRLRQGGVRLQLLAVGGDVPGQHELEMDPERTARRMIEDVRDESVQVVETPTELESLVSGEEPGFLLHLEGCRPLERAGLEEFVRLGIRSVGLTWNGANAFADGIGVERPAGLTARGRELVGELDRLGILIDVSHLAPPGFWDVVELARGPIIATHANASALTPHPRNLDDEQARAVATSGGIVGVCFIAEFIGAPATCERLLDHVDHLAGLVGIDSVGVGPDYVEFFVDDERELRRHLGPEGHRRVETLPVFSAGLLGRGYAEEDVAKIVGGNALRVLRETLEA